MNWIKAIQTWINGRPTLKYVAGATVGAATTVLMNFGFEVATGKAALTAANLKQTLFMAASGAFVTLYGLWQHKPGSPAAPGSLSQ